MDHMDLRPVVVGVDGAESARAAAAWAAATAAEWGAPLRLVLGVAGHPQDPRTRPAPAWLAAMAEAADRAGVRRVSVEVQPGDVVDTLVARSYGARMLVLGSFGAGASAGMLAGSLALTLLGRVSCPIAVVRGAAPGRATPHDGPIVVGVDGSPAGAAALAFAADLAAGTGAALHLLHTWSDVDVAPDGGAHRRPATDRDSDAQELLSRELAPVVRYHPELPIERDVRADTPLRALISTAPRARMIVVGTRGHEQGHESGDAMMLGSTSAALVAFAPCPVVVVHARPVGAHEAGRRATPVAAHPASS